jgi:hypothetical protein
VYLLGGIDSVNALLPLLVGIGLGGTVEVGHQEAAVCAVKRLQNMVSQEDSASGRNVASWCERSACVPAMARWQACQMVKLGRQISLQIPLTETPCR